MARTKTIDPDGKPDNDPAPKRRGWISKSEVGTKRGFIYFVRSDDHVKIGFTNDVHARLPSLQTGNHQLLIIEEYFASFIEAERLIHERFEAHRVLNEWFNDVPEIDEFIEDVYDYQLFHAVGPTPKAALRNRHQVFLELETVAELLAASTDTMLGE
jgi:hypothetical protein